MEQLHTPEEILKSIVDSNGSCEHLSCNPPPNQPVNKYGFDRNTVRCPCLRDHQCISHNHKKRTDFCKEELDSIEKLRFLESFQSAIQNKADIDPDLKT